MAERLTQEIRWKIAVWHQASGSIRQTQRLFIRGFGINLAPTRQTIYVIHRKIMATGSVVDIQLLGTQGADARRKRFRS